GSDINIPTFLLDTAASDRIRTALNSGAIVNISLTSGDVFPLTNLADTVASFSPYGGVYFPNTLKPDITAPGANIYSPDAGSGNNGFYSTGTSGSAPHVAGVAALQLQQDPTATPIKINWGLRSTSLKLFSGANSAPPERGPNNVGGGRVDAQAAATTKAVVRNSQTITAINLYGDVIFSTGAQTNQQTITLSWNDASATSYTAVYNGNADVPGADVSLPNPTGTAPPNSTVNIPVAFNINPAALKRSCAPWISLTQAGNPRHCLAEEQGYVTINLGNNQPVRAPIYYAVRPASQMGTSQNSVNLANPTGTSTLNLTGQGVNNGPTQPADWRSLASPFELQWIDPNDSTTPPALDFLDLQYVGARSNFKTAGGIANTRIIFGLSTYGDWASPNQLTFNVFIDANRDGRDDFQLFTTSFPNAQGAPSDVFVTRLLNISTGATTTQFFANSFSAAMLDTAVFYNNTISLPVSAQALGLTDANGKFDYQVKTSIGAVVVDTSARLTYDATKPGLDFGASTIFFDLNGQTIPVGYNLNDFRAANSEGALLLHHFNTRGNRAQILPANLGREGDVAPRPSGNGSNTIADWTQIGRFVAGLDDVNLGNEFQRADVAPRATSGNGALAISDWVQAGRYAAGLDQPQTAGGPVTPTSSPPQSSAVETSAPPELGASQARTLRALNANFTPGQANTLSIELGAQGGENALGFSLNYDPAVLSFVAADVGGAAPGATLLTNTSQTANGRAGIALALPAGQGFAAGARRIVNVRFNVAAGALAAMTQVSFGDQPILREIADVNTNELTANYANALVTIGRTVASVSAASFSGTDLAAESIASAFGSLLATRVEVASSQPLPTTLAGTTVRVKDSAGTERLSPLFFISPAQINYQMAPGTVPGPGLVTVTSGDGAVSMGSVNITTVAPGLFAANANGQGVAAAVALRARADGSQSFEPVAVFDQSRNQFVAAPIDPGPESDQVFLVLFGTGWRFRSSLAVVTASVGGVNSEALFASALEGLVGLDQLNLRLSRTLAGRGEVDVALTVDGKTANIVKVAIK
ncbi:MAG: S8 family serine peptidase, partial [Blastocatellia bacterium]